MTSVLAFYLYLTSNCHSDNRHHINFKACFPLLRAGLVDKSSSQSSSPLRTVLSVSRISYSTSFHVFLDLSGLFCATAISFAHFSNPACSALYVSRLHHPSGVEHHIQVPDARSLSKLHPLHCLRRREFSVAAAKVSVACIITLLTHVEYIDPPVRTSRLRLMGSSSSWQIFQHEHLQACEDIISQPPQAESMSPR